VYNNEVHKLVNDAIQQREIDIAGKDNNFYTRLVANTSDLYELYQQLYSDDPQSRYFFNQLICQVIDGYAQRSPALKGRDDKKLAGGAWYLSQDLAGMSLYVDRWCGQLKGLPSTFDYLKELGVNLLHLMPIFQSPPDESDGGYAVSDFRKVDPKFGSLEDLRMVRECMDQQGMYLMLDIVPDLTSHQNPAVLVEMLGNIFFYANLGVDILRIDAPAHTILRLIKQCVQAAMPGMAILGEAIVTKECDLAYNATHMALQWDALATGDTRIMLAAQPEILQKPNGTSWITYTRGHDDIGLGYEDYMIQQAGYQPFAHRRFLQDYYSGNYSGSDAMGALFSVNPKTQDVRICGSLASLCGLEKALLEDDGPHCVKGIRKILLMQAHSFFIGGIPMLFYGDESGHTNDYSYLSDPGKSYDNRWMHRPVIDWNRNEKIKIPGTVEHAIFSGTQKLIGIRRMLPVVADHKNLVWMSPHNIHVAGFVRWEEGQRLYCLFNFSGERTMLPWYAFKVHGPAPMTLYDYWGGASYQVGPDDGYLVMEPYTFMILEERSCPDPTAEYRPAGNC
jgi:glycosidase